MAAGKWQTALSSSRLDTARELWLIYITQKVRSFTINVHGRRRLLESTQLVHQPM